MNNPETIAKPSQPINHGLKMALEMGPLLIFFVVNAKWGIMPATAVFMVTTTISLAFSYIKTKRLPAMLLIGGSFIMVFGGLTLALDDDMFIKLKPTIVNTLFAAALFTGLATGRNFLKNIFESAIHIDDDGWRKLTWRWAWFFILLAVLNELVWRTQTTDTWVSFKVFGIMPLTLVFSFTQLPLIFRHQIEQTDETD
ncbi:MAG: septation protein A [Rhodospirillaceae bacterium]|nr:septation protein A [Rhodospirillaceae bacterium]